MKKKDKVGKGKWAPGKCHTLVRKILKNGTSRLVPLSDVEKKYNKRRVGGTGRKSKDSDSLIYNSLVPKGSKVSGGLPSLGKRK